MYSGVLDAFAKTLRQDGPLAFYNGGGLGLGWGPKWLRGRDREGMGSCEQGEASRGANAALLGLKFLCIPPLSVLSSSKPLAFGWLMKSLPSPAGPRRLLPQLCPAGILERGELPGW